MYNAQIWVLFMYKNYKDLELHLKRKIAILTETDTKVKQLIKQYIRMLQQWTDDLSMLQTL